MNLIRRVLRRIFANEPFVFTLAVVAAVLAAALYFIAYWHSDVTPRPDHPDLKDPGARSRPSP